MRCAQGSGELRSALEQRRQKIGSRNLDGDLVPTILAAAAHHAYSARDGSWRHLFASLDFHVPVLPAAQAGSHTIAIQIPSLVGYDLHCQGAAWDFPGNPFGMVTSNGLTLTVGNP